MDDAPAANLTTSRILLADAATEPEQPAVAPPVPPYQVAPVITGSYAPTEPLVSNHTGSSVPARHVHITKQHSPAQRQAAT